MVVKMFLYDVVALRGRAENLVGVHGEMFEIGAPHAVHFVAGYGDVDRAVGIFPCGHWCVWDVGRFLLVSQVIEDDYWRTDQADAADLRSCFSGRRRASGLWGLRLACGECKSNRENGT